MRKEMKRFVWLVVAGHVAICSTALAGEVEAVKQFESRVTRCKTAVDSKLEQVAYVEAQKKWVKRIQSPAKLSYDVTRTDSLVTPLKGVIEIFSKRSFQTFENEADAIAGNVDFRDRGTSELLKLEFGYRSGEWVFVRAGRTIRLRGVGGEPYGDPVKSELEEEAFLKDYEKNPAIECVR